MINSYWPAHPQPKPDEIFSSWIHRVARANGKNFFSLCYCLAPEMKNAHYNCDYVVTSEIVNKFCQVLRTPYSQAFNSTLDSYVGYLFEESTPKANRKSCILQTGIKPNDHKRFNLQYCPVCLSCDEPYFRKKWRISLVTVCTEHACQLYDRCPECEAPVRPLRNEVHANKKPSEKGMTKCCECGFDLKGAPVKSVDEQILVDTCWYEEILRSGYVCLDGEKWIYSFSFFSVLRHLIRCLTQKSSIQSDGEVIDTDTLNHEKRYSALCRLSGLFSSWPASFIKRYESMGLRYYELTAMSRANTPIPFWLDSVVKERLYTPNVTLSEETVKAAIDYLIARDLSLNASVLNRFLGFKDSSVVNRILKQYQREKLFHLPYMRKGT